MSNGHVPNGDGKSTGVTGSGRIPVDAPVRFVRTGMARRRAAAAADPKPDVAPDPARDRRGPGASRPGGVSVPVVNRPARFPAAALWPLELRADLAAAMLDFQTTRALCKAVGAGEAPPPTSVRGTGRRAEPVWSLGAVTEFVARRHGHA